MRPSRSVQRLSVQRLSGVVGTAAALATAAAALVGCQPPPKPAPPPPAPTPVPTADQVGMTQQQFAAVDPRAHVGHVAGVMASDQLAAVSGIPLGDVKVDDPISFVDANHNTFANGTIFKLDSASGQFPFVMVKYEKTATNGRDPMVGDLAITVPMDTK